MIRLFFLFNIGMCFVTSGFSQSKNTSGKNNSLLVKTAQKNNESTRKVLNLNTNWAFFRGDAKAAEAVHYQDKDWTAVSIPHTMRLEKKHNGGGKIYQGIGWYRRYFKMDQSNQGKRIT